MSNRNNMKKDQHETNPCYSESQASLNCIMERGRDQCKQYFANYTNCKKFWAMVENDRWSRGIQPNLPPVSEREAIRKQYLERN